MSRRDAGAAGRAGADDGRDRGAALIVAVGFVVMIGAISAGLASLVTSSMNNRITLTQLRDRQYAADGAVEVAIAEVRSLGTGLAASCGGVGGSTSSTLNDVAIRVDWHDACGAVRGSDGTIVAQRNVIFAACVDEGMVCTEDRVLVRAQVNFEQGATGDVTSTFVQSWSVNR